jgi:hypothetical protein
MLGGLLTATLWDLRRPAAPRRLLWLTWGAIYLLAAFQGTHPTKGYLCFPGALMFLCVGRIVTAAGAACVAPGRSRRATAAVGGVCVVLLMAPGAGARAWWAQVSHWSEPDYNGPKFARRMLEALPRDGRYVVDTQYVFDVWLSGRKTVLAADVLNDYPVEDFPYDVMVVGREGLDKRSPERYGGIFVRSFGERDNLFACYAEVYRSPHGRVPVDGAERNLEP